MRYLKRLKITMPLILAVVLLASCGSGQSLVPSQAEPPFTVQETEETPPSDQDAALEEPEPNADQETFLAS